MSRKRNPQPVYIIRLGPALYVSDEPGLSFTRFRDDARTFADEQAARKFIQQQRGWLPRMGKVEVVQV